MRFFFLLTQAPSQLVDPMGGHRPLPVVRVLTKAGELFALDKTMLSTQKLRFALHEDADVPMDNLIGIVTKVWMPHTDASDDPAAVSETKR